MNGNGKPSADISDLPAEPSIAALARLVTTNGGDTAPFSICATCGRRVEGTDKRKYCGRQCANRALLVRRRIARTRMIERLAAR